MSMLPEPKTSSKLCKGCNEVKDLTEFYTNPNLKNGRAFYCKSCHNERSKQYYHDKPWSVFLSNMKGRTRQKGWEEVEWTKEEIEEKLSGCCEVTGIPFDTERSTGENHMSNPFIGSPDRIDNSKGYTKENTRWVVLIFNVMHGNFSDEQVKQFIEHLRNNEINL
jgi:hypothetical protein